MADRIRSDNSPARTSWALPPFLHEPWNCHQYDEIRSIADQQGLVSQNADRITGERVYLMDFQITRFWDVARKVLLLTSSRAKI